MHLTHHFLAHIRPHDYEDMTLSTSIWGWWKADQTRLWFTPCQGVACSVLNYTACRAPAEAGGGKMERRERRRSCASALVMVHESHQPLLGTKLSLHGWQLEINAFLTDKLNKCMQLLFGTNVDLQYCPAKPTPVFKVHREITPETRILSFCCHFLLQRIQTTSKLLAGNC